MLFNHHLVVCGMNGWILKPLLKFEDGSRGWERNVVLNQCFCMAFFFFLSLFPKLGRLLEGFGDGYEMRYQLLFK